jgi:hypothetical protein
LGNFGKQNNGSVVPFFAGQCFSGLVDFSFVKASLQTPF